MQIPFVDLKTQFDSIQNEIEEAVNTVFHATNFIQGSDVSQFENSFAKHHGAKYCISVNSGTDALILGMRALHLSAGDEVIIPVNTFIATSLAASENGFKPVFVDIDPKDYGINLNDLKKKITRKTKAIIVVHLYGQPDKLKEIQKIIKESGKKIHLIEDACQAHSADYKGKKVGTFGIFSAFSFYPGKNLGAYGDGGALVTNNKKIANEVKLLREYGQRKKYYHDIVGTNTRLDTIQAAILNVKLKHLKEWTRARQQAAKWYNDLLKNVSTVQTPAMFKDRMSVYHLYVIQHPKRDKLIKFLGTKGITALIHYPIPLHLQKAYKYLHYKKGDFPHAEKAADKIVSLPMYPELTRDMVEYVVKHIQEFET